MSLVAKTVYTLCPSCDLLPVCDLHPTILCVQLSPLPNVPCCQTVHTPGPSCDLLKDFALHPTIPCVQLYSHSQMSLAAKLCTPCAQAVICALHPPSYPLCSTVPSLPNVTCCQTVNTLGPSCDLLPDCALHALNYPLRSTVPSLPYVTCTQPFTNVIPYSQKYWQSLNLAGWLQTRHSKILTEFKLGGGPSLGSQNCQVLIIGGT